MPGISNNCLPCLCLVWVAMRLRGVPRKVDNGGKDESTAGQTGDKPKMVLPLKSVKPLEIRGLRSDENSHSVVFLLLFFWMTLNLKAERFLDLAVMGCTLRVRSSMEGVRVENQIRRGSRQARRRGMFIGIR